MDADADVWAIEDLVVIEEGPEVLPEVDGIPLHRFLDRAKPSLAEAASLASLFLEAVAAMHESGCGHGAIESQSVRVVPDGTIRLADWGSDAPFPVGLTDEVKRSDIKASAAIVEEITKSAGRPARPLVEVEERLLSRLSSASDAGSLLRRGPLTAARGLNLGIGRTERRQAARQGVVELAKAIATPANGHSPGPTNGHAPGPVADWRPVGGPIQRSTAPGAPSERTVPPPARRPPLWPKIWKVAAALGVVALILVVELRFFGDDVRRNVDVLTGAEAKPALPGPRQPDPLPVLGPPAAGPITHLELRPLETCRPETVCNAVVQLTVAPQNAPLDVAWGFELVDRCNGRRESRPGGVMSVPPGKDRAVQTVSVPIPAGRALALVPVTNSPARVAGLPMPLSARDTTC